MFKLKISVQADKVSIYEEHEKIGCTSLFTQAYHCGVNPSLLGGWMGLRMSLNLL